MVTPTNDETLRSIGRIVTLSVGRSQW